MCSTAARFFSNVPDRDSNYINESAIYANAALISGPGLSLLNCASHGSSDWRLINDAVLVPADC